MESFCLLQLQRPAEAIDILEPVEMQAGSQEPLLASAYDVYKRQVVAIFIAWKKEMVYRDVKQGSN